MTNFKNLLKILFLSTMALGTTSTNQLLADGAQDIAPLTELIDNNTTTRTTPVFVPPTKSTYKCEFCFDNNLFDDINDLVEHFIGNGDHIGFYRLSSLVIINEQQSETCVFGFSCSCGEAIEIDRNSNDVEIIPQEVIEHIAQKHATCVDCE